MIANAVWIAQRPLYLAHYLRRMDWQLFERFMEHTRQRRGISRPMQWLLIVWHALRYNVSLLECYQFGFFDLAHEDRARWAGTGTMYEFQRRANPPETRDVLADKRQFFEAYRPFFRHSLYTREKVETQPDLATQILCAHETLVFKGAKGNCGAGIEFWASSELDPTHLADWMRERDFGLVESNLMQHPDLQHLSPSGVNTVRIFTALDATDRCRILGCRLRIAVDSPVDNLAAGNLAAPVEETTGEVTGPGVYSDVTRTPESVHPVTGVPIEGFRIPFWEETLALARAAAEHRSQNRSVGWDIVITPEGPGLIEGNHDWCKLVWQLPVQRGLKQLLKDL